MSLNHFRIYVNQLKRHPACSKNIIYKSNSIWRRTNGAFADKIFYCSALAYIGTYVYVCGVQLSGLHSAAVSTRVLYYYYVMCIRFCRAIHYNISNTFIYIKSSTAYDIYILMHCVCMQCVRVYRYLHVQSVPSRWGERGKTQTMSINHIIYRAASPGRRARSGVVVGGRGGVEFFRVRPRKIHFSWPF